MASNHFRKSFYTLPCVWLRMENRIFRKSISFDRKIKALTRKLFYVSIFTSNHLRTQTRKVRKRRESRGPSTSRNQTRWRDHWYSPSSLTPSATLSLTPNTADPLPHASPSSTHSPTSTKDPPTVSFLFQLSSFLSPTTSPPIHPLFESDDLTSPHLTSDPYTSNPPFTKADPHPLKPI